MRTGLEFGGTGHRLQLHTGVMIIVVQDAGASGGGAPLRPAIVIDSLFTKNMHNEFIMH